MKSCLLISGSIRNKSHNTGVLKTIENIFAQHHFECQHAAIESLPHFDQEMLENNAKYQSVALLRKQLEEADAVFISTPEYNHSISGVLKNALDWCSTPYLRSPFYQKPVAIMSVTASRIGGTRAIQHLKLILSAMLANAFIYPEVILTESFSLFDSEGSLVDVNTQAFLQSYIESFLEHYWR